VRILSWSYIASGLVHGLVYLVLWLVGFFSVYTPGGFEVQTFAAAPRDQNAATQERPQLEDDMTSKFFRIDFLPALDPQRVIYVPPTPEPIPEPPEPTPPPPEPVEVSTVEPEVIVADADEYVRPELLAYSAYDEEKEYIRFPELELTDVFGDSFNAYNLFGDFYRGGRPAVIVFCDVSREQGYNDLTHWADMWVWFLERKGIGEPPHVICIGNIIDDPYVHPIEYYDQALKMVFADYRERVQEYTQTFAVTGVIDVHNEILRELSNELDDNLLDLRKPILMLVDNWGVIRVMMWGRPVDIEINEFDKAGSVIREMWEMKDWEYTFFRTILLARQIELRKKEGLE